MPLNGWQYMLMLATQILIAAAMVSLARDVMGVSHKLAQLRREVRKMAISQDDVKALADAVGRLIDIAKSALDAAASDKAAKEQALADLGALKVEVEWLNDPELDQKIDDLLAAASAATPAP